MAATDQTDGTHALTDGDDDADGSGVGMAHPTVVPGDAESESGS